VTHEVTQTRCPLTHEFGGLSESHFIDNHEGWLKHLVFLRFPLWGIDKASTESWKVALVKVARAMELLIFCGFSTSNLIFIQSTTTIQSIVTPP